MPARRRGLLGLRWNAPPGVSLDDRGRLSGTPSQSVIYTFTVSVEACFVDDGNRFGDCFTRRKGFALTVIMNTAPHVEGPAR